MDAKLFVRVQGKVIGPLDHDQLRSLRDRGRFRSFHEVSPDRVSWRPASSVPGLVPAGFVVCGLDVTNPDGSKAEVPTSTGSCFAVTPDGYLVTNKHVVEDVVKMRRSPLLKKICAERSMEIKPTVWVFFGQNAKYVA